MQDRKKVLLFERGAVLYRAETKYTPDEVKQINNF